MQPDSHHDARTVRDCFSPDYAHARQRFLAAAQQAGAQLEHHALDGYAGAHGEALATDVALLGRPEDAALLMLSSGVHGVEGFCGSGCQVALLEDEALLARLRAQGVALLLVHAVNPYGFSHLRRVNEHNIDLNRNFVDFTRPTVNPAYAHWHPLLLPTHWPPSASHEAALNAQIDRAGYAVFREAVTTGQSDFPDGLFYSGVQPSWSQQTLRRILRHHAAHRQRMAWIDVHTGLGPCGHGEKIHGGRPGDIENLRFARALWGADVVAAWEGDSTSQQVVGHAMGAMFDECPQVQCTGIALEYGTRKNLPLEALRADHWCARSGAAAGDTQRAAIGQALREAFYVDEDEWRGMTTGQCRTAVLQAALGLGRAGTPLPPTL